MSKVGRAEFDRPILHGVCDYVRNAFVKRLTVFNGLFQCLVGCLGQTLAHNFVVKNHAAEHFGNLCHIYLSILSIDKAKGR